MLDFKGWMIIPNVENLCHLLLTVPFCRELPSPLPVELPAARLGAGDGGLLREMGRRREPSVVRCVGVDLLRHPSWC